MWYTTTPHSCDVEKYRKIELKRAKKKKDQFINENGIKCTIVYYNVCIKERERDFKQ